MGFHVLAEFLNVFHQTRDGLSASCFLANAHHLALVVEVDDGTDADEATHGSRQSAHATAATEELQVISEEIHRELRHLYFSPFHDFLGSLASFQEIGHFKDNIVTQGTDAQCVNGIELSFGILRFQFLHRLIHDGKGVGSARREMRIKDVVSRCEFRLKILDVSLFAHGTGGRHDSSAKHVVEFVGIELIEVDVGVNHLITHGIRHANEFDAIGGALLRSDVAISVAKKSQHFVFFLLDYDQ